MRKIVEKLRELIKKHRTFSLIGLVIAICILFIIFWKISEDMNKKNITEGLKKAYGKEFVIKGFKTESGVRWTVGLSTWERNTVICYRKDIPNIEFEADIKDGKVVADNYQRRRLEYEAMEYFKPYFDAITNKYFIFVSMSFNKKGNNEKDDQLLQEVDVPLYLELHKKTFKEIIQKYPDYLSIAFLGRLYTDKKDEEIEIQFQKLTKYMGKANVNAFNFSLGIYNSKGYTNLETVKEEYNIRGSGVNLVDKSFRGTFGTKVFKHFWIQRDKEKYIKVYIPKED